MPYIGHILTSEGVQADPGKVKVILEMTKPTDVAGVRRIPRTVNYLAKFLPHLSQISEPLRELTRNGPLFAWEKPHDDAFLDIKKLISTPPVLKYYEPNKDLTLQCDASDHGLGAALIQEGKPVTFASWRDHITGCLTCDQYHDKHPKEPLYPTQSPESSLG